MNLFQPLSGIERVSPVKACGLDRRINLRAFRSPLSPFARPFEGLLL